MTNRIALASLLLSPLFLIQCTEPQTTNGTITDDTATETQSWGGFESQVAWGEHLVIIGGCNDCHTPKKMTNRGPVLDSTLWLSGHPAEMPGIEVDRKAMESQGLVVSRDLTEWVGPWGVSYTANLTPDESGTGNWTEDQFKRALREGKFKGLENGRTLLPPMPWEMFSHFTDDEVSAIFAYLKTIKPIRNVVPAPLPPASAEG